jgi:type IV pilus assembly protein PilN
MRVSVNLATRPFVELRPLFAKLRLAALGLALLAVIFTFALRALRARETAAETQMNALKAKTVDYQQERQHNEVRMRQPQNQAILARSQFLNALFISKGFSWTAVMMDLERVLPPGVQVTSIEPTTSKTGDVTIRLRVSGDREKAVELVRNLERSQRFVAPRLAGEQMQAQDSGGHAAMVQTASGSVEFDILSGYNPLPQGNLAAGGAGKEKVKAQTGAGSEDGAQTVSRRARRVKKAPPSQRHLAAPGGVR